MHKHEPDRNPERDSDPREIDIMVPLGGRCYVPASRLVDLGVGARFRAARLLAGLTFQETAERANESPEVLSINAEREQEHQVKLTAELVQRLETDPEGTPFYVFPAVAYALGRSATDIMEMEMISISSVTPDADQGDHESPA